MKSSFALGPAMIAMSTVTADAQNLVPNGNLDSGFDGWTNQAQFISGVTSAWEKDTGRGGSGCLHIVAPADVNEQLPLIWRAPLREAMPGKRIRFSAWVRGNGCKGDGAILCAQAWDDGGKNIIGFGTTQQASAARGVFDWKRIDATIDVPKEAKEVHLLAFLMGAGEAWFDDVEATVVGDADPNGGGMMGGQSKPGLFLARGEYEINSQAGGDSARGPKLKFPLPLNYREQVPLTFEVKSDPAERLKNVLIFEDVSGNFVAEVELTPGPARLSWRSLVLVAPRSFDDVPKAAAMPPDWPDEAKPWLRSTRFVAADAERVVAIAKEIRGELTDVLAIIDATLKRTRQIYQAQKGQCQNLGAVEALDHQGSCTSCANLVAALLRANHIPARILAGYPSWSGPLQTHYIVEAWVPGYGWYPIESTMLKAPWLPASQINVAIIPTDYENDRAAARPFAAGGVPYLSLTETVDYDGTWSCKGVVDAARFCDHEAKTVVPFPEEASSSAWQEVMSKARTKWSAWVRSNPRIAEGAVRTDLSTDALSEATSAGQLLSMMRRNSAAASGE